MKRKELEEMIRQSILAEMGSDAQYADETAYSFVDEIEEDLDEMLARISEEEIKEGADSAIVKLADKVEDLPIVDKLADKIQANPKAMDALNKLAAMYGGSVNEDLGGIDLSTIIKKSQAFADKVNEGDASFTASGVLGGPLLMGLLGLIPGAMETVVQTVNSAVGMAGDGAYEPAFLLSVAGGVLIGAIIDKIKNNLEEVEEGEDKVVDPYLAEAEEEDLEAELEADIDTSEGDEEVDVDVDAEEEAPAKNDSIVIDKKIVSLSSLPGETRKILDTLETLRAQAEEFGDQKFITQVGNTITFFTRDFVVAGDQPTMAKVDEEKEFLNESLTFPIWNKIK